jgi:SAM-dependent MidA family methyltransferase
LTQLFEIIAAEIKKRGVIPFEEFMRLALYCPVYGYYEKEEDRIGRNGDFYTSVSVGNLFGELLAFQFAEWLAECQSETGSVQIVEAGAHCGHLARDILTWFGRHRPELFHRLQYWIIEPSSIRQKWQRETLAEFTNVRWLSHTTDHASRFYGVVFSNELLDAMPIRRLVWNAQAKTWLELAVTLKDGKFGFAYWEGSEFAKNGMVSHEIEAVLPDGFVIELCPEAERWWREAAQALELGKLMTIDYGMTTEELVAPERKDGTLRAYYCHHPTADLLDNPGEQDLTAHVNFSALIAAGEANGLKTETFETQAQFLTKIAARAWENQPLKQGNDSRARQFQTLTHPEHLGRSFRVLVQSRETTS